MILSVLVMFTQAEKIQNFWILSHWLFTDQSQQALQILISYHNPHGKVGLGKKQFDPKVRCSSAHKCRLEIAASAVALWFLEHCQHSPWLLRSLDDYVLQLPFDTWEGKLYHVEFALKAKLKSQTACVIILSHHITMKCHGPIHYTDSKSASRSFIFSWPRLSSLPDTICILPCIYVGQVKSL